MTYKNMICSLFFILTVIFLFSGCEFGIDRDNTRTSDETTIVSTDCSPWIDSGIMHFKAVVVTWGEVVTEAPVSREASGGEDLREYTYIPVEASYDHIFESTFNERALSDFYASNCYKNGYLYLPDNVARNIKEGDKQLIFLHTLDAGYGQKIFYDHIEDFPMFDIIDGKIRVSEDDMAHIGKNEIVWDAIVNMDYVNKLIRTDFDSAPIFGDGMLISDFETYLEKAMFLLDETE